MRLVDDTVKKLEESGDVNGLVKRLLQSEGRRSADDILKTVDALERLGAQSVPVLAPALASGHPAVPGALGRIGAPALDALARRVHSGNTETQIGAALAVLLMKVRGDQIEGEVLDELARRRDKSPYLQVVAFSVAALRPAEKAKVSAYYKTCGPGRELTSYQRSLKESWQWADAAGYVMFPKALQRRHEVADNILTALKACEKASRAVASSNR